MRKTLISFAIFSFSILFCTIFQFNYPQSFAQGKEHASTKPSKISPLVYSVSTQLKNSALRKQGPDWVTPPITGRFIKVDDDGSIQLYITLSEVSDDNLDILEDLGLDIELVNSELKTLQGWAPSDSVEEIAALDFVEKIKEPDYSATRIGSVTTEGDSITGSDLARSTFGVDGTGIKVGVISFGIDNLALSQGLGDLPESIEIDPLRTGSGDEGTALLEIIHDLAPGAALAYSGPGTSLEFIEAINFLTMTANVDIIVDDLGFLNEPFLEDGPIAIAANNAATSGRFFVSAAGNDADRHYQHLFTLGAGDFHDFGAAIGMESDIGWELIIPPGGLLAVFLQWSDPFGASGNDYDLFIAPTSGSVFCLPASCISEAFQDGNDEPSEFVLISNPNATSTRFDLLIKKFAGDARTLEIYFNGDVIIAETIYNVTADSVFGHPAAPDVIAVGAVPLSSVDQIDFFSSRGPVSIFSPSPLTPLAISGLEESITRDTPIEVRSPKPDVVAPNRISVTGVGTFPSTFAGTSASAPHVAAVLALMLEAALESDSTAIAGFDTRADTVPSIEQIKDILFMTAVDLGSPGADDTFGNGRIDAFAAVEEVINSASATPPPTSSPTPQSTNSGGGGGGCAIISSGISSGGGVKPSMALTGNLAIVLLPILVVGIRYCYRRKEIS